MKVKVIPVKLEVDLKNHETPLQVQYIVELTTEVYNDIMSSGMTYIADPEISKAVENLVGLITTKISSDLGILEENINVTPQAREEDL